MRKILDEGSIERRDADGNEWIGNWIAFEDQIERRVEVDYLGETRSSPFTESQNFDLGRLQVASMLFEQILRDLGHNPLPAHRDRGQ